MNEEELAKLPKCYICKNPMGSGTRTKAPMGKHLYLCDTCRNFFRALAHDIFESVFADLMRVMDTPGETWVEQMEPYDY